MPLKLSLKPGETLVVNGAVMQNGERRGVLLLQNHARVLREKDIMREAEATTPLRRIYFATMLHYLAGEVTGPAHERLCDLLGAMVAATDNGGLRSSLMEVSARVAQRKSYRALILMRDLINEHEAVDAPLNEVKH